MSFPSQFCSTLPSFILDKDAFLNALQTESPTSIRYNSRKIGSDANLEAVPWCTGGFYLPQRPVFTLDPLLHAGAYYVQEASSMFLAHALNNLPDLPDDLRILDLCAAPGGKTTLISNFLNNRGVLVANEVVASRVGALSENVQKWGNANTIVTNCDADVLGTLTHAFDVIVCDAPCSGEGMFRKDAEAVAMWSEVNVELCSTRQKNIVDAVWEVLRPGGFFIYSTCTFNIQENESVIAHAMEEFGAEVISLPLNSQWGVYETDIAGAKMYRFLPHLIQGEGFSLAVLRKPDDEVVQRHKRHLRNSKQWAEASKQVSSCVKPWFSNQMFFLQSSFNELRALTPVAYDFLQLMPSSIRLIHVGVDVAEIKGKDYIPMHGLALCPDLHVDTFYRSDLSLQQALQFLHKDALLLGESVPKSWVIMTYENLPLGFIKNLGNRTNNNYPSEWRIRMNIS